MGEPIKISELQTLILDRLKSCSFLNAPRPVEVLSEDTNELQSKLEQILKELGGMAVLIGMPTVQNLEPSKPTVNSEFTLEIAIAENTLLNRDQNNPPATLLPCGDVVMAIFQRLHAWKPNFNWAPLRVEQAVPIRDETRQIYELIVKTDRVLPPLND